MLYLIDTNIFLRVLIKEDEMSFQSSLKLLEAIKHGQGNAVIPGIVLTEINWTLRSYYKFPKPQVVAAIQGILNLRGLMIVDNYNHQLALDLYQRHAVKYVDACIASLPAVQERQATIISFDHDFDKIGIARREPHQIELP
jgi:predicted nucleic-acid-binding protein